MRSLRERLYDRAERKEAFLESLSDGERKTALETPLAGIGTVNPLHPVTELSGNGGFSAGFAADAANAGPAAAAWPGVNGNEGEGGQSTETADETVNADGKALTKAELAKLLDDRNVTYESDANLERLQTLVRENPAKA